MESLRSLLLYLPLAIVLGQMVSIIAEENTGGSEEHNLALHHAHSYLMKGSYLNNITLGREFLAEQYFSNQLRERYVRVKRGGGYECGFDFLNANFPCLYGEVPIGLDTHDSIVDGHKFACGIDHILGPPIVYSFGCNRQIDFETGILNARPDAIIHVFELDETHLLKPEEVNDNRITFHHLGLGPTSDDPQFPLKMLKDIMIMLNHTYVDVLKVDIEGGEHEWIEKEPPSVMSRMGQLLMEVHCSTPSRKQVPEWMMIQTVEKLEKMSFRIFHKELNIPIYPCATELSLMQRDWVDWNLNKPLLSPLIG
jgi:Methyltransferase domain